MPDGFVIEKIGRATVFRFNRPEIRSPLSSRVIADLTSELESIGRQDDSSGVVFTGMDDVFASGADLREVADLTVETAPDFARRGQSLMNAVAALGVPTIAAVNGYCFGGALDLATACGRRLCTPNAEFAHPGAGLGIMTGWGGTQRLPRLIGEGRALEMFLTAGRFGAEDALRFGLVDEITDDVVGRALELLSLS
jgi:enoyl-CoA hydratase